MNDQPGQKSQVPWSSPPADADGKQASVNSQTREPVQPQPKSPFPSPRGSSPVFDSQAASTDVSPQPPVFPQVPPQPPQQPVQVVASPPPQVHFQVPPQTVVASSPKVISPVPSESAGEFQDRVIKTEQMSEVKRVKRTYKLENAVGVLFGSVEASLAMRLIFKLLGASAGNAFVNILYQFTGIFANPFSGIFGGNPSFGRFELDLAAVIAMIVYAIVGYGALQLTKLF
ncbi:MAG TPA: hypothetical protein VMW41_01430 [Candidatus Bathyarchaeia archaeon]|nr:hypothetical protein [Candidatus Bathyarchaeia archaeon]